MNGEVAYSGSYGSNYRLRLTVTLLSQDTANNRSLVRVQADMRRLTTSNFVYNLNSTSGSITYDGTTASRTMSSYDFRGSLMGPYYFTTSYSDVYINHNADGTKTANFQAYHDGANSPYLTTATVSFDYTLPTINRYAAFTALTYTPITDVAFSINASVDNTCDLLEYSLNNGSSYTTGFSGDFTSKTVTLSDLPSDTTYQVITRVRRKDSQLKTTSSMTSVTTGTQNNFMGFL